MSLYIVSTPVGNLDDMTFRAVKVLNSVQIILTEDTRVSHKLLNHFNITTPVSRYHDFNKEKVTPSIIEKLNENQEIALITDAGTPGIADPAFFLVRAAIRNNIQIIPVPGASAILPALVCSGLPTDRFVFDNFLPRKSSQRKRVFDSLKTEQRTVIFYETPHRIIKVLNEMAEVLGDIQIVIARELTKVHEEFLRGTPAQLCEYFTAKPPKGEMVVLLNVRSKSLINQ